MISQSNSKLNDQSQTFNFTIKYFKTNSKYFRKKFLNFRKNRWKILQIKNSIKVIHTWRTFVYTTHKFLSLSENFAC